MNEKPQVKWGMMGAQSGPAQRELPGPWTPPGEEVRT